MMNNKRLFSQNKTITALIIAGYLTIGLGILQVQAQNKKIDEVIAIQSPMIAQNRMINSQLIAQNCYLAAQNEVKNNKEYQIIKKVKN